LDSSCCSSTTTAWAEFGAGFESLPAIYGLGRSFDASVAADASVTVALNIGHVPTVAAFCGNELGRFQATQRTKLPKFVLEMAHRLC